MATVGTAERPVRVTYTDGVVPMTLIVAAGILRREEQKATAAFWIPMRQLQDIQPGSRMILVEAENRSGPSQEFGSGRA
jgi:hypothetical protein